MTLALGAFRETRLEFHGPVLHAGLCHTYLSCLMPASIQSGGTGQCWQLQCVQWILWWSSPLSGPTANRDREKRARFYQKRKHNMILGQIHQFQSLWQYSWGKTKSNIFWNILVTLGYVPSLVLISPDEALQFPWTSFWLNRDDFGVSIYAST